MKLSIVIPAHNEEHRLPPVLKQYAAHFSRSMGDDFEILVVANGSTDRTAEVAREIAGEHPGIKVIDEPLRIGKGGAVILGIKAAQGDWVGFVDADGATSAEEFERLFGCGLSGDGVIGSRWKRGAKVNVPQTGLRLLSSRLFNLLIRTVLGLRYEDTQCGAKIFTSKAWKTILPKIGITRFAFDVDVLFQLKREGFQIVEEPTVWNDVEGSKVRVLNSSFDMFCAVFRMRLLYSPLSFIVVWYEKSLSRLVEFFLRDDLFRHTSLLFVASIVTAFGMLVRDDRRGGVSRLLKKWVLLAGGSSVVLSAVCIIFSRQIAAFFHLERVAPVVVSAAALPAIFIAPVLGGALQGLQRFRWTSIAGIANAFGRVLFGGLLVTLLFPACGWALAGHVGGMYLALLVSLVALRPLLRGRSADRDPVPSLRLYLAQCFFIQIGVGVLMTADVVLVKHFLPDDMDFAFAATLGRMVAFMAAAVAMAMFPKVSSSGGALTREHRKVYLRSQLYTGCLVGASLAICILFPAPLLRVLFKITQPSFEILSYTRWMALVMAVSTLLNINVFLLMAQRRFRVLSITVVCAIFYLAGVYFHHESAYLVIAFAGVANMVALGVTTGGIFLSGTPRQEVTHDY
jgi:glycosyltransferase involved in cell wall biosynthesis